MTALLRLFGRSPFALLKTHMGLVGECVHRLRDLFEALESGDVRRVEELSELICVREHEADVVKNDIRNHLPKSLFLPIDRGHLLEMLTLQDDIADAAEDVAVLVTLKELAVEELWRGDLRAFVEKNIEAFDGAVSIIDEMHELLESSFGGIEAEKVRAMIDAVAVKEHEVDIFQRKLLKVLFSAEERMPYTNFILWVKVLAAVASISNYAEKLAYRVRMTLEIK